MQEPNTRHDNSVGKDVMGTALAISLIASLGFSLPVSAGNNFANVKATAECTLGSNSSNEVTLMVDAGIVVTKTNEETLPYVGTVAIVLEEHTPGTSGWSAVIGSEQTQVVEAEFTDGMEGDSASVATFDYPDIDRMVPNVCDLVDLDANAVRAVVDVEVKNANANKRGGQGTSHLARCVSFANPC